MFFVLAASVFHQQKKKANELQNIYSALESEHIKNAHAWVSTDQLDPGEAEAIGLALQVKADWLLTDDAQARRFAERLALEVHGSVGLLLWAVAAGHLNDRE